MLGGVNKMNLFGLTIEKRADVNMSDSESKGLEMADNLLYALLNTKTVTREQALEIPSVKASLKLIADTIAALPINLYMTNEQEVTQIENDRRVYLLNCDTRDTLTAPQFWRAMIEDYYIGKGAYAYINKQGTEYVSLHYVKSENISFMTNNNPIFKDYDICVNGAQYNRCDFLKILRNSRDGWKGVPIQEENKAIMAVAYNELIFEKNLVETGGGKKGFLTVENVSNKDVLTDLKRKITKLFTQSGERVAVFNKGADFKELTTTPTELQLNENKETNSVEISMLFNIPNSLLRGSEQMQSKDMESFINFCIVPLVADIEACLDRDLLTESEKEKGYHFFFDIKELKRGNIKERYEAYAIACQNNFLQVDEIREKEDLKPLGFKYMKLGLDSVLYDLETGDIYTPNTNEKTNMKILNNGGEQKDENGIKN